MMWTPEKWAEKVLSEAVDGIRNPEGPPMMLSYPWRQRWLTMWLMGRSGWGG